MIDTFQNVGKEKIKPLDSYAIRVGILTWVRGGKTKVSGDISTV